jgi:urocanate hydratase
VHGTTITLLNAGANTSGTGDEALAGKVYVTSGLGGMSGAQAKAAVIAGAVGVVAEVNPKVVKVRHEQGWVMEVESDLDKLLAPHRRRPPREGAVSLAYRERGGSLGAVGA